jgi:uncharacterized membrane protein (DUF4010 family)
LPEGAVGPWKLIEPRAAWVTVILISGIGFVNYILWKVYGARGTELSGFLGGLVNSNFTVIELASRVKAGNGAGADGAYRGILLATAAMVARNAALLLILAPLALLGSIAAFVLMGVASGAFVLWSFRNGPGRADEAAGIKLELPFSLPQALKYGLVFLVLHIVGSLTQREFGSVGFYFVSIVGGLMSSASAVAAAATLASQGDLSPSVAGTGAVLASFTSIAFSLSFVVRSGSPALVRRLTLAMVCVALAGAVGLLAWGSVHPWVARWIPQLEERVFR